MTNFFVLTGRMGWPLAANLDRDYISCGSGILKVRLWWLLKFLFKALAERIVWAG